MAPAQQPLGPHQGAEAHVDLGLVQKREGLRFHRLAQPVVDLERPGDDGVHLLDFARWGLETAVEQEGGQLPGVPRAVSAHGGKYYFDDAQEWPDTLMVTFTTPLTVEGQFFEVLGYLYGIADLERIVRIDAVALSPKEDENGFILETVSISAVTFTTGNVVLPGVIEVPTETTTTTTPGDGE